MKSTPALSTQVKLAAKTGLGQTTIGRIRRGEVNATAENLRAIADAFGVTVGFLYGEADVDKDLENEPDYYNAGEPEELVRGRYVAIVGIGQGGPDGFISIDDYSPGDGDGYIYTYSPDPGAYGIRVRGDSMRPRIKSGEYIVAEPNIEAQPGDDVVVKLKDGRAMVKEMLWIRDGELSLGSINNGVPPITVPLFEVLSVHRVAAIVPRGSALLKPRQ